jgi:hypothetical protein
MFEMQIETWADGSPDRQLAGPEAEHHAIGPVQRPVLADVHFPTVQDGDRQQQSPAGCRDLLGFDPDLGEQAVFALPEQRRAAAIGAGLGASRAGSISDLLGAALLQPLRSRGGHAAPRSARASGGQTQRRFGDGSSDAARGRLGRVAGSGGLIGLCSAEHKP